MRRLVVALVVLANGAVAFLLWNGRSSPPQPPPPAPPPDATWAALDPQSRCDEAAKLLTRRLQWPTHCRWRRPDDRLEGQAYPPPAGPPPWDDPRVEVYVAETQTPEQLAKAIAHEHGHMHHTREPAPGLAAEWLAARSLPWTTPDEVWTEDYAEVFAALFSPPNDAWRAPTTRPSDEELVALKARFFS